MDLRFLRENLRKIYEFYDDLIYDILRKTSTKSINELYFSFLLLLFNYAPTNEANERLLQPLNYNGHHYMCCHHSSFLLTIDHRIRLIVASQLSSFSSPFLRSHRHHLPPSPHESRLSSLVCVPNHSLEWAHRLIVTRAMRSIH